MRPEPDQHEIPLFPLPNVVLFPNVLIPLHIFEERYKVMMNACIDDASPFGMVLLKSGQEEGPSSIHRVGVAARVVQVERLDDGRMNILGEGEIRFRILEFTQKFPLWRARVEFFEDEGEAEKALEPLHNEVSDLYLKAYRLGLELASERPGEPELPKSAAELSFLITYVLDIEYEEKQKLLEIVSTRDRLSALVDHLKNATQRLEQQLAHKKKLEKIRGNGDFGKPSETSE